jgi:hypothetical protein
VVGELVLEITLVVIFGEGKEIKDLRVFKSLLGKIGLSGRQGGGEVGGGGAFACEEIALDLVDEDGAAPAVGESLADVVEGFSGGGAFGDDFKVMAPRDL